MSDSMGVVLFTLLAILAALGIVKVNETINDKALLFQCEKALPRGQHCKIIAVVDDKPRSP